MGAMVRLRLVPLSSLTTGALRRTVRMDRVSQRRGMCDKAKSDQSASEAASERSKLRDVFLLLSEATVVCL